jgi:hypothetical protein
MYETKKKRSAYRHQQSNSEIRFSSISHQRTITDFLLHPYAMTIPVDSTIQDPNFLRMQIAMHFAHNLQGNELRTLSERHLYFNIARGLLDHQNTKQWQPLKVLSDPFTERILRERIKEFESVGLIQLINSDNDKRTKHLVPTQEFLLKLNEHMKLLRQIGERYMFFVEKV